MDENIYFDKKKAMKRREHGSRHEGVTMNVYDLMDLHFILCKLDS